MIITFLIRLLQLLGVAAFQILLLNHVHLFGYATPMCAAMFLVWFPLNANRIGNMLWAFALGLLLDAFSSTPGMTAAALTFTAFLQWPLLKAMAPKDSVEDLVPTFKKMGTWNHVQYVIILFVAFHFAYFLIDAFSFFNFLDIVIAMTSSCVLSLVIALSLESLRNGK